MAQLDGAHSHLNNVTEQLRGSHDTFAKTINHKLEVLEQRHDLLAKAVSEGHKSAPYASEYSRKKKLFAPSVFLFPNGTGSTLFRAKAPPAAILECPPPPLPVARPPPAEAPESATSAVVMATRPPTRPSPMEIPTPKVHAILSDAAAFNTLSPSATKQREQVFANFVTKSSE